MTLAELMLTICHGTEKNADSNLRNWLNKLCRGGYLIRERVADGKSNSSGSYRYRLVQDSGPKAPVVRVSDGTIFDPNSGEVFSISPSPHPSPCEGEGAKLGGDA